MSISLWGAASVGDLEGCRPVLQRMPRAKLMRKCSANQSSKMHREGYNCRARRLATQKGLNDLHATQAWTVLQHSSHAASRSLGQCQRKCEKAIWENKLDNWGTTFCRNLLEATRPRSAVIGSGSILSASLRHQWRRLLASSPDVRQLRWQAQPASRQIGFNHHGKNDLMPRIVGFAHGIATSPWKRSSTTDPWMAKKIDYGST
eukprot:6192453-Pleurochrysis_carterae.AAC.1